MIRRFARLVLVALLAVVWTATVTHADVINRFRLAFNEEVKPEIQKFRAVDPPIYRNSIQDLLKNANMWRKLRSPSANVGPDLDW